MTGTTAHIPVLLEDVVAALAPKDGDRHVDGTFGAGGYTLALLGAADCMVIAIDRDPSAVQTGQALADTYKGRLTVIHGRFGEMDDLLRARGIETVNGVALDLGVSSMQLDQADRGFSFRFDGPLDMRMETQGPSAADLVNGAPEAELADIIYRYGEERHSRRVAKAIVLRRADTPFTRTLDLAGTVRAAIPGRPKKDGIDPATRTFQALRIAVNDELGEIGRGLEAAEAILAPGGRLAVVSFHSLEDRIVKSFLRDRSGGAPRGSRHAPETGAGRAPTFTVTQRRPVGPGVTGPGTAEAAANPRARSARLRAAQRTAAPAWPKSAPAFLGGAA
jgi:16S rRNA (cytosine1402-N4)-methyltransferase